MSADLRRGRLRLRGRRAETNALDELLRGVLAGQSGVLILRGEAGIGKSALLNSLSGQLDGWHVARAVGVESELELAYNGLHQICSPMLGELERLPEPQRDALATVFGLSSGAPPDRFMVGLATLTLLATVAQERPLACIVDDAQWLDQASAQIVAFVARRLLAERIAIVCAVRSGIGDDVLVGLPELPINRLRDEDARSLLLEYLPGPLDSAVRDQIIMESHGHPLALLELARGSNITALAGGFGVPASQGIAGAIQRTFVQRLDTLPAQSRLFVLLAAAEPLGDPILLHSAGRILGLEASALDPAVEIGLVEVGQRVEFVHPLVRSAAYRTASREDLHSVHRALAEATDQERDPDRRAWHRARATPGRDEEVAAELERSSARAQARGGIGAAAAFLQRAVELTEDEARRSQRALAAAQMSFQAGAFDAALKALDAAEAGELDEAGRAQADLLRGVLAVVSSYGKEAVPLLLRAAKRLESIDLEFARRAYLTAWGACVTAGHLGEPSALLDICLAVRAPATFDRGAPSAGPAARRSRPCRHRGTCRRDPDPAARGQRSRGDVRRGRRALGMDRPRSQRNRVGLGTVWCDLLAAGAGCSRCWRPGRATAAPHRVGLVQGVRRRSRRRAPGRSGDRKRGGGDGNAAPAVRRPATSIHAGTGRRDLAADRSHARAGHGSRPGDRSDDRAVGGRSPLQRSGPLRRRGRGSQGRGRQCHGPVHVQLRASRARGGGHTPRGHRGRRCGVGTIGRIHPASWNRLGARYRSPLSGTPGHRG